MFAIFGLAGVLTRLTAWGSVYDSLSADGRVEWRARVASTVHALICVQGAIRAMASFPDPKDAMMITELSEFYASFTFGYFVFDVLLCLGYQTNPPPAFLPPLE